MIISLYPIVNYSLFTNFASWFFMLYWNAEKCYEGVLVYKQKS